ncbi:MAG: hypothetical protein J6O18_01575 [Bacilli bacterium]|nr:hypothetical protein [Bacilli bacterium]
MEDATELADETSVLSTEETELSKEEALDLEVSSLSSWEETEEDSWVSSEEETELCSEASLEDVTLCLLSDEEGEDSAWLETPLTEDSL